METQAISAALEAAAAVLVGAVGLRLAWGRPLALAGFGLIVAGLALACAGSLSLIAIGPMAIAAIEHGLVLAGVAVLVAVQASKRTAYNPTNDTGSSEDRTQIEMTAPDRHGISGFLHELSQPIHIIRMSAEGALLKIGRGTAPPDFIEKQFSRIEEQCARLVDVMEAARTAGRADRSAAPDELPAVDDPAPEWGGRGDKRVLLVDDEHDVATTLADFLTTVGLIVRVASEPRAALTFVEEGGEPPDILVTDLRMPGMGGLELIRRLRQTLPGLPVVVITGNAPDDQDLGPEFDNDHTILLRKPVHLGTLDGAVCTLLGGRPYRG